VAQPALSRSIAKLEEEIGQSLFVRHSGGVTLTEAGALLYDHVTIVLRDMQRLTDEMAADMDTPRGAVVFGVPPSFQSFLTAPVAAAFVKAFPDATLNVIQNASGPLREGVASGRIDVAMVTMPALVRGLHYTPLFKVNRCLICPAAEAGRFGEIASIADLVDVPLILCGYPDSVRVLLEEAFGEIGAKPNIRCEVNNGSLVIDLVAEGAGIGLAPYGVLGPRHAGELAAIPVRDLDIACAIATSFERIGSAAVRRLSEMLIEHTRALVASGHWTTSRFDGPAPSDPRPRTLRMAPHLVREFGSHPLEAAREDRLAS
jgi:LysR family nitrogen assimilation transcriptional regulator